MIQKKICMVGSFGVGKTSLVSRYVRSIFSEKYLTTVGVKIDKKPISVEGKDVTLVLWDLAGEDAHTVIKPAHLRGGSGYILVVDGLRRATLDVAIDLQGRVQEAMGPVPFVCVINKADLRPEWQIKDADLEGIASRGWNWLETSARTGDGVEELFQQLATAMLKNANESETPTSVAL
jgi:small GTP-binding protein